MSPGLVSLAYALGGVAIGAVANNYFTARLNISADHRALRIAMFKDMYRRLLKVQSAAAKAGVSASLLEMYIGAKRQAEFYEALAAAWSNFAAVHGKHSSKLEELALMCASDRLWRYVHEFTMSGALLIADEELSLEVHRYDEKAARRRVRDGTYSLLDSDELLITDRRTLQEAVRERYEQAEQVQESIRKIIAYMRYELRVSRFPYRGIAERDPASLWTRLSVSVQFRYWAIRRPVARRWQKLRAHPKG
jgi:hypothetical protein